MTDREQQLRDLQEMGSDELLDLAERHRLRSPGNLTFYEAQLNRVDIVTEVERRGLSENLGWE